MQIGKGRQDSSNFPVGCHHKNSKIRAAQKNVSP